ncbi:sel1 repeat family protein [Pseudaquidulcibacter saccharophilus]|uniref:sel1 repeat family protein n=1 Tax=Pseudaquidulcibacter saccharophilus TaxID=2831900 RepID=UPI001EFF2C6C|nr:sel1 repeat family protein [Pseudaquidulcibacter saccharophilus]
MLNSAMAIEAKEDILGDLFAKGLSASTGVGAELDLVEAHKWFNIAALKGNIEARMRRVELAEIMTENQISAAQKAARDWLSRAKN